ncbi:tripartite tricarboxylate transporter permease, partial [Campylobacter coli]
IFPICLAYCVGITNTFESFIYHQFLPLLNSEGVFADIIRAMYAMTTLDGHPLAKKGQAGKALSISALSSFIGSFIAICGIILFAP